MIVHGGHVLATEDPMIGFENWRKCIEGLDIAVPLLIENTAGGGNAMARQLERLDEVTCTACAAMVRRLCRPG